MLITGGSRGLGLLLALRICAEGGRVALLARDREELGRARDQLVRHGAKAIMMPCDLMNRAQIGPAVQAAVEQLGSMDVLINNAGIIEVGPLAHMQREDLEKAMELHFWAAYELIMQTVPLMRRAGGGRIVNITSIGGKIAAPHLARYCASKFALVGLSDSIRAELAQDNIQVTTVAPGMMRTGSHVNARFKGDHAAEFSPGFPSRTQRRSPRSTLIVAAAQNLAACRQGRPALTITLRRDSPWPGMRCSRILTGYAMKLAARFLPAPMGAGGDELWSGWKSRERAEIPAWLTHLADRATERNNESSAADPP